MNTILPLNTDSYKISHYMQYPEGTEKVFSYIESRGGKKNAVTFFGLQAFIKKYLMKPITKQDIDMAEMLMMQHLGPGIFNRKGWDSLLRKHHGFLPVEIRAVDEGAEIPTGVALVTIENTDPEFYWVTSYLETAMLRDIWYGTTVCTISKACKKVIKEYLDNTSDDPAAINFMLHDFGYRGVSSDESAAMGGLAHLVNFMGTDTMAALVAAIEYYNAKEAVGFSVIASEHSTMCTNADPFTKDDFASAEKMVSILEARVKATGTFQIVSAVADTYDVYRFTRDYIGTRLKDRIMNSGGRFVVRPDSGNPEVVPVELVEILLDKFGYTTNSKGFKVLPPCIRVLQGDGINEDSIAAILKNASERGIAADNFVFGMGGALLQHCDRDWQKFAMKCSAVKVNGVWRDVYKDPITDAGKRSKRGRLVTVRNWHDKIVTLRLDEVTATDKVIMDTVYRNGTLIKDVSFENVRAEANK